MRDKQQSHAKSCKSAGMRTVRNTLTSTARLAQTVLFIGEVRSGRDAELGWLSAILVPLM